MTTKIGLPENRAKLKGAGIIKEKDKSFTEGYNACLLYTSDAADE